MEPAERQEIIEAFRYEFQTFKDDQFKPLTDSVKEVFRKDSDQDIIIRENTTDIKTMKGDVKENRTSIGRMLALIISSLITILGVVLGLYFLAGG